MLFIEASAKTKAGIVQTFEELVQKVLFLFGCLQLPNVSVFFILSILLDHGFTRYPKRLGWCSFARY